MKLTIMVGLPASGKTTMAEEYAEKNGAELVSIDAIKAPTKEKHAIAMETLKKYLEDGKDVVLDGIYLTKRNREAPIKVARSCKAEVEMCVVGTKLDVCLERNKERKIPVSETYMTILSHNYEEPTKDEYDAIIHRSKKK